MPPHRAFLIRSLTILLALGLAGCSEHGERHPAAGYDLSRQSQLRLSVVASDAQSPMRACASFLRSSRKGQWIGEVIETWWILTPEQRLEINGVALVRNMHKDSTIPEHYCAQVPVSSEVHIAWHDEALNQHLEKGLTMPMHPSPRLDLDESGVVVLHWTPQQPPLATIGMGILQATPPWQPSDGNQFSESLPRSILSGPDDGSHALVLRPQTRALTLRFVLGNAHHPMSLFSSSRVDSVVTLRREFTIDLKVPAQVTTDPTPANP